MPRHLFFAISFTLMVALTIGACSTSPGGGADGTPQSTRTSVAAATAIATPVTAAVCEPPADAVFCADPAPMQYAVVLDVIDGDTFDALIDGSEERVRLFGVDTPERGDPCYGEATDALRELAAGDVRMRADVRDRDPNGRLLRYVYTPEGLSIDATLIAGGLAVAWTRDGAERDALVELERLAREAGRGCLWR